MIMLASTMMMTARMLPDEHLLLHAPYTPFTADGALNATEEVIGRLAGQANRMRVNTIFVGGSMGEFDSLSPSERKSLMSAWVAAAKPLKGALYIICQVGSTDLPTAIDLAGHAEAAGCDAIASVPPYYETTSDVDTVIDFLRPIASGAPKLPLFFYHIPVKTHCNIRTVELFRTAAARNFTSLAGVKWVGDDLSDWFEMVREFNHSKTLLFAPEPKLASFGLGFGRGAVLAEDFYAPTYSRMRQAFLTGNLGAASDEQAWKYASEKVIHQISGSAKRALYRKLCAHVDIGPPRLPQHAMDESDWPRLEAGLAAIGFWADKAACA